MVRLNNDTRTDRLKIAKLTLGETCLAIGPLLNLSCHDIATILLELVAMLEKAQKIEDDKHSP